MPGGNAKQTIERKDPVESIVASEFAAAIAEGSVKFDDVLTEFTKGQISLMKPFLIVGMHDKVADIEIYIWRIYCPPLLMSKHKDSLNSLKSIASEVLALHLPSQASIYPLERLKLAGFFSDKVDLFDIERWFKSHAFRQTLSVLAQRLNESLKDS